MGPGENAIDCSCCTGSRIRRYLKSKFPFIAWMRAYNLKCLQGDIIAGLTVGMMVIPQGLAYAHLAELPPNYGLYASFIGVLVYIFTGTSKDITIGPTAIMSQIVAEVAKGNTKLALCCSLFAGCFQVLMGFFFLGFVVWVISTPILCGFTTAAALTIAFGQLSKLLGIKGVRRQFWRNIYDTLSRIKQTNWPDAVMGVVCLIILFAMRFLQRWTEAKRNRADTQPSYHISPRKNIALQVTWFICVSRNIIIVISATIAAYLITRSSADPASKPFTMVGNITGGLPKPRTDQFSYIFDSDESVCSRETVESQRWTCRAHTLPNKTEERQACLDMGCCWDPDGLTPCYSKGFSVSEVLSGSILITAIGYLEHIAIGQSFAVKSSYQIDNSQELIALGLANVVGSFFSSYPVTGSFSRTALSYMAGVKTPLVGLFTSTVVMLGLSFLSSYFQYVPDACLAAVIIVAVYPMVDFAKPIYLWKVSKKEFFVWMLCFILILAFNIEVGILVAIGFEICLLIGRMMWPSVSIRHIGDGTYDVKIDGSLWYLGAFTVKEKLSSLINGTYVKDNAGLSEHPVCNVIIDFTRVSKADSTALDKIKEAVVLGTKRDIRLLGYGMTDQVQIKAAKQGLLTVMIIEKNQEDAARSVKYATDESGQPAYVRFDDSIITPKLVVQSRSGSIEPGHYRQLSDGSANDSISQ